MFDPIRRELVRVLRIPPPPAPPAGTAASIRVFRASRRYYQYAVFEWLLKQAGAAAGIVAFFAMQDPLFDQITAAVQFEGLEVLARRLGASDPKQAVESTARRLLLFAEAFGLVALVVQMPFTYAMVRLDYELRWYIVTDRSLRIREGILRVREMTMTFANIQNVSVEKGPVQRLLGIADLRVRSAGGGSDEGESSGNEKAASMHVGYFRGVDNAAEIRSLIFERLRLMKSAGLGDPEDAAGETQDEREAPPAVAAAHGLLEEARALRRTVDGLPRT